MKRHLLGVIALLVSFIGGFLLTPVGEYGLGMAEARYDLARGVQQGKRCIYMCIEPGVTREYERMLQAELNFKVETVESCGARMRGYNEVQAADMKRRYGGDVFERMMERALQRHRQRLEAGEQ